MSDSEGHLVLLHAFPLSAAMRRPQAIVAARLALVPGAGHLSNLETPEPFSRAVHDFLVTLR